MNFQSSNHVRSGSNTTYFLVEKVTRAYLKIQLFQYMKQNYLLFSIKKLYQLFMIQPLVYSAERDRNELLCVIF
ncbi:hypothetical protein LX99_02181 [Mucilaginibacter oryzae]|uniref:Uncharacterized protein n=1 Tax=Mucilaginibacter oryzae TaxID=468058 RepID=A0A316HAV5_9SPHI|nr:hypothetical protein LX99_02181 [Mucilaginibacter oryzae]